MKSKNRSYDYMYDCIHLKACRRLQKYYQKAGFQHNRGCNEFCTAYLSGKRNTDLVSQERAINFARSGADSIQAGHSEYDVWCYGDLDFNTWTLQEVLEEFTEE